MSVSITALYAGILALIFVALAINVTRHRVKLRVALGDGGNPEMLRMIRLHANAVEYIPLALVLMALYELNGGWHVALHIIGIVLIVARAAAKLEHVDDGECRLRPPRRAEPDLAVDRWRWRC